MTGLICSKCLGPREVDSSSGSYCRSCVRTYQRERYRASRRQLGLPVRDYTRTDEEGNRIEDTNTDLRPELLTMHKQTKRLTVDASIRALLDTETAKSTECPVCRRKNVQVYGLPIYTLQFNDHINKSVMDSEGFVNPDDQELVPVKMEHPSDNVHGPLFGGYGCRNCRSALEKMLKFSSLYLRASYFMKNLVESFPDGHPAELRF